MLGQFLEFSVAARPLAPSFDFFRSLGFASIPVADTLPDPYAVLFAQSLATGAALFAVSACGIGALVLTARSVLARR